MTPDYISAITRMQSASNAAFTATTWIVVICLLAYLVLQAIRSRFDP